MKAVHFLKADMKAGSGREKAWTVGEERMIKGDIALCKRGYHWGRDWYSALQYAPGPVACIVDVDQALADGSGKGVSQRRKLIQAVSVGRELRLFAADCAERGLKAAKVTDERSWNAIAVARKFADGEAPAEELDAASAARNARSAARNAVWDADRAARDAWDAAFAAASAARNAAWAAASATDLAAWDSARIAARDAAFATARDAFAAASAARNAETKWQRKHLQKLLNKALRDAK